MKKTFAILALLSISGCGTMVFVNRNPVKDAPSFTVIPAAYNDYELNYAAAVESEIARTQLKIIERPPFKFMDTDATRTDSAAAGGSGVAVGTSVSRPVKMTDTVAMYEDTKADYIVNTYYSSDRIRIIKKSDATLVATLQAPANNPESISKQVYAALGAAGFIKGGYDETRCTTKLRPSSYR